VKTNSVLSTLLIYAVTFMALVTSIKLVCAQEANAPTQAPADAAESAAQARAAAQAAGKTAAAAAQKAQTDADAAEAAARARAASRAARAAAAAAAAAAKSAADAERTGKPRAAARAAHEASVAAAAAAKAAAAAVPAVTGHLKVVPLPQGAALGTHNPTAPRHWIVYNAVPEDKGANPLTYAKPLICEGASVATLTHCQPFLDPESDYFTSGSLIYVVIENASTCATYSIVNKDDVQIAEDRPLVNGVPPPANLEKAPNPCPTHTIALLLGQYSNDRVTFSICESVAGATSDTPCTNSSSGKPQSSAQIGGGAKKSKCPCPAPAENPPKAPVGSLIANGAIEVHKLYRANIVAGFFVSSLVNRQYGITNNGQSTASSSVTYVTVVGPSTRPQYHAYVGVNVYPWRRDVFPGAMSRQGFLWWKTGNPKGLNGYWNPGILIGYGVDATNNYLLGLNWETFWGINIGSGVHIGQEARLQPGIVPGVTQLPNTLTAAPTYNQTNYGWYGSVGFDLSVMKAALGQLFGAGGSVSTK
jgi:hypothetical protein